MKTNEYTMYRLIHSQEMVRFMWKYTLHMQSTQIPCAVAFCEELDFPILARAVNVEIERNDCLRIRLKRGVGGLREYFLDRFELEKIPIKDFSSKEEMTAFFDADASKKLNVFSGETFRIFFFRIGGGSCGIYLNVSHMIMDAAATFIFFKDLMNVYDSLKTSAPLPRPLSGYEEIIKREQNDPELEKRIAEEGRILDSYVAEKGTPHFGMVNGDGFLDRQRKLLHKPGLTLPHIYLPIKDETHMLKLRVGDEESRAMTSFVEENHLSAEWLIQLGFRLSFSRLNHIENDTLFWVLCPRRRTVKEKRCGGTLASPMPWREKLPDEMTFSEALRQLSETQAFLFRYSDVPFTTVRSNEQKRYRLSLIQSMNCMMFSYLPLSPDSLGKRRYEFFGFNFGHYVMPLYTVTLKDPSTGNYVFSYIHRLWLSTDEEVERFHKTAVNAILRGIEDPNKTVGEIIKEI